MDYLSWAYPRWCPRRVAFVDLTKDRPAYKTTLPFYLRQLTIKRGCEVKTKNIFCNTFSFKKKFRIHVFEFWECVASLNWLIKINLKCIYYIFIFFIDTSHTTYILLYLWWYCVFLVVGIVKNKEILNRWLKPLF